MSLIHPTAVVEDGARVDPSVKVGPFCHIGPDVEIGEGSELQSHVVVAGRTKIGPRARIFPFASVGHQPQDLKYKGEPSTLEIGADVIIRETVTLNPGTEGGGMKTVIGDRCAFLAGSHVGHDCKLGNDIVLSNNALLAGHCTLGDFVICGGGSAVLQFLRVGKHAFISGMTGVPLDVIPYGFIFGNRGYLMGINVVGLRRRGFTRDQIHGLRSAYKDIFESDEGTLRDRVAAAGETYKDEPVVMDVVDFIQSEPERAICVPEAA